MKMKLPRLTVKKTHALTYSVVDPDLHWLLVSCGEGKKYQESSKNPKSIDMRLTLPL
jgi:hypothetical protein